MIPKQKIGIIGSGFIVNDCHLPAYRTLGLNINAIASRTNENARKTAKLHKIPKVHENIEALLDDSSIEILDIAVPPQHQPDLILAACQRGTVKGILAQKPLALDYATARNLVDTCKAKGIMLAVNQNMRFDPSVAEASSLLSEGRFGDAIFTTITMRGIPHWQPWQAELESATLKVMSIHHLLSLIHI